MNPPAAPPDTRPSEHGQRACPSCLRRSWLLGVLAGTLNRCARDPERLYAALNLTDEGLIDATAGRRREEVRAAYKRLCVEDRRRPFRDDPPRACVRGRVAHDIGLLCVHDPLFPAALRGTAPRVLALTVGGERLRALAERPVVAIVGARGASDYGVEMGRRLGRGLSASGVTVLATLADGVSAAAHAGALQAQGGTIAVLEQAPDAGPLARRRSLLAGVLRTGCAVGELPLGCAARRLGTALAERLVGELASITVVVEAVTDGRELALVRYVRAADGHLAAVPGRVTSPLSAGTNALLHDGANVVRSTEDVLELVYALAPEANAPPRRERVAGPQLEPRLAAVLARVGAGDDTAERLTAGDDRDPQETLAALSELELMGLLSRGDGGRYLPSDVGYDCYDPLA